MEISPSSALARHPIPTCFLSSQISFVLSCSTATRWEEPLVAGGSSAAHKVKPPPPPRLLVELVEPPSQPSSQSHAPIASRVLHIPADSSQEEPAQHRRGPCRRREELVVELHPSCTSSMRRALQLGEVLHHAARPCRQEEHSVLHPHRQSSMGGSCAAALCILVFRDAQPEEHGFCPGSPISLSTAAPRKTEGGARRRRRPPASTRSLTDLSREAARVAGCPSSMAAPRPDGSCSSSLLVRVVLAEQEAPTGDGEAATPRPSKRIPVLCTHLVGWSSFSPPWTAPDEDGEQRRTCAAQVLL